MTGSRRIPYHWFMPIDKTLLEILACPLCKTEVRYEKTGESESLVCTQCARRYPIRDDIPVILVEEAQEAGSPKKG